MSHSPTPLPGELSEIEQLNAHLDSILPIFNTLPMNLKNMIKIKINHIAASIAQDPSGASPVDYNDTNTPPMTRPFDLEEGEVAGSEPQHLLSDNLNEKVITDVAQLKEDVRNMMELLKNTLGATTANGGLKSKPTATLPTSYAEIAQLQKDSVANTNLNGSAKATHRSHIIILSIKQLPEDDILRLCSPKELDYTVRKKLGFLRAVITLVDRLKSGDIRIICGDDSEAAKVRLSFTQWSPQLNPLISINTPYTLHGVVIHGIPAFDNILNILGDEILLKAGPLISFTPIKSRNPDARAFSALLIMVEPVDALKVVKKNSIVVMGRTVYTEEWDDSRRSSACIKCGKWSHKVLKCTDASATCHHCAADHLTKDCAADFIKCLHCNGDHKSYDRICPLHPKSTNPQAPTAVKSNIIAANIDRAPKKTKAKAKTYAATEILNSTPITSPSVINSRLALDYSPTLTPLNPLTRMNWSNGGRFEEYSGVKGGNIILDYEELEEGDQSDDPIDAGLLDERTRIAVERRNNDTNETKRRLLGALRISKDVSISIMDELNEPGTTHDRDSTAPLNDTTPTELDTSSTQ